MPASSVTASYSKYSRNPIRQMPNPITIALGLIVVALIVYAVGIDRTKAVTTSAASKTKRAATSGYGLAAGGAVTGLAAGDALFQFVASDPATLIAGLSGALGTLGMAGTISLSPLQYALIVVGLLIGYAALFTEATEEDDD